MSTPKRVWIVIDKDPAPVWRGDLRCFSSRTRAQDYVADIGNPHKTYAIVAFVPEQKATRT